MAGYIAEFFGYRAEDSSNEALMAVAQKRCPFLGTQCTKMLSRDHIVSGVCAIRQKTEGSPNVICCPIRIYAEDYKMLRTIASNAFGMDLNLYAGRAAVGQARSLPQREGTGSYFVDWVLARLDATGELVEFTAIEVQTIDTTGNYRDARQELQDSRAVIPCTVGLNWENVSKRIIPQLIYKGQVLQRENLCRTGLYFVCPQPVFERVLNRLSGREKLPHFPTQPA